MQASKMRFYSVGTAAENLALGENGAFNRFLEVTAHEVSPMFDGELDSGTTSVSASGGGDDGAPAYSKEVETSVTHKAEWLPINGSNRVTPPNVRRGESVILYQFADSDKYWWATLYDDSRLRRLETVVWAFSGTKDEGTDRTSDTDYFMEVSTHKGLMHLHTGKGNGEPFAFDVQINAKDGCIIMQDDQGNIFSFDSKNTRIEIINNQGSSIDMDNKMLTFTIPDLIAMKTKSMTVDCETLAINATTSASLETGTNTIKATTTHTGNFTEQGMLALLGGMSTAAGNGGDGEVQIGGALTAQKGASVTGDVSASGTVKASLFDGPLKS